MVKLPYISGMAGCGQHRATQGKIGNGVVQMTLILVDRTFN